MDTSKIRRELGWLPPYSLQQGLEQTVGGVRYADMYEGLVAPNSNGEMCHAAFATASRSYR